MPKLLRDLKKFYKTDARKHLPWRPPSLKLRQGKANPYPILVAEMMLQQTQVERVIPFYTNFLKQFPTPKALAKAPLSKVLAAWQGLGYNRRAKFLHQAAKIINSKYKKQFPTKPEDIEALPGVGHYTARAVVAFAFNKPEVFVETNIRTVLFHSDILKKVRKSSDAELLPLVGEALRKSKMQPRDFYAALMDYGAHLKKQGVRLNSRSKHYAKQSKFEGSARQLRGAIVRELLQSPATLSVLIKKLSRKKGELERELGRLQAEGMITRLGGRFRTPQ